MAMKGQHEVSPWWRMVLHCDCIDVSILGGKYSFARHHHWRNWVKDIGEFLCVISYN